MKHANRTTEYILCAESIDRIADEVESLCVENRLDPRGKTRIRLSVEESLLSWMEHLGEGRTVVFSFGYRLFRPFFQISVAGDAFNPYSTHTDDFGVSGKSLLANIGLIPVYAYTNGRNSLTFTPKKESRNPLLTLLIVILSALVVGIAGRTFLPDSVIALLSEQYITPINDTFFNILKAAAGPMIFLSVAWGIYGIGDVYTLGRIGKKLMISFVSVVFLSSLVSSLFFPLYGKALTGGSTQFSQFGMIFRLLLGIFPDNVFSPFIEGNTLQIIFLAFIIGLSMIFLGQRTSAVARAVEQINHIINFLMDFISKLVPFFVFVVLVQLVWSDSLAVLFSVWKFAVIYLLAYITLNALFLFYTAFRNKTGPLRLLKACLPSYVIGLTTASSAATFESNMTICRQNFGIEDSMVSFGIPFGMVMFKPNAALYNVLFCFYLTTVYSVNVTFGWLAIAIVVTAVCAIATPPIPGGAAATYTMLFLQLGIPAEALAIALAVDLIFDFFITAAEMVCLPLELYTLSGKLGMRHSAGIKK